MCAFYKNKYKKEQKFENSLFCFDDSFPSMLFGLTYRAAGKIAALSFVMGACMELFMIKTGFYSIVTRFTSDFMKYLCLLIFAS